MLPFTLQAAATHDEEHPDPQLHPTAPPDPLLLHRPAGGINAGHPVSRSCTSPIGTHRLRAPTFPFHGNQPMWGGGYNAVQLTLCHPRGWQQQAGTTGTSAGWWPRSCWPGLGGMAASWCGTVSPLQGRTPCASCEFCLVSTLGFFLVPSPCSRVGGMERSDSKAGLGLQIIRQQKGCVQGAATTSALLGNQ